MALSRINAALKAFGCDRRGVAAVEFGMIAPVSMLIMLGTVELGRAVVMSRRFNLVTAVVSDLVAREPTMTNAELTAISTAALVIWQPYDQTTLKFQVLQIRNSLSTAKKIAPNTTYVDWSYSMFGAAVPTKCQVYPMPANMIAQGTSNILVNGWYTYTPLFGTALPFASASNWNWTSTSSHATRNTCTDYNGPGTCLPTCE